VLVFFGDMGTATGFDIFTNPLSGGTPTAVVQGPLTDAEPDVSPDGRWIAYATTETGNYEVFVQPLPPTGAKWQVSTGGGRQPRWRRDGRELYFVTNDRKFYVVDVRAGATFEFGTPGKLFDMPSNTVSVRNSYEPSKDGQRFLVNKLLDTAMPPVNVVVNWATTMEK
jgi:Tol biopolymer transport system component